LSETLSHLRSILSQEDVDVLDGIWHSYGSQSAPARSEVRQQDRIRSFNPALGARCDAARNFRRTGGRLGRKGDPPWLLRARTSYFREEYAHGERISAPGISRTLHNGSLIEAARLLYGMPIVLPYLAYGNLLVPGQELGLHTDVPAFRGADRTRFPLWLLVVMRHSELFERWRIPIATAVAFVGDCAGGEFVYYPEGSDGPAVQIDPAPGSVVVLDADTIFHGVDRVIGDDSGIRSVGGGRMRLLSLEHRSWKLETRTGEMPPRGFSYRSGELRFSLSWKAYCFEDEGERSLWTSHADDLNEAAIIETLVTEMCNRGVLVNMDHGLSDTELGLRMVDAFVRFPDAARDQLDESTY
jgi:hypothetical protein